MYSCVLYAVMWNRKKSHCKLHMMDWYLYCRIPWFGEVAATSSIAGTSRSGKGGNHQLWWKRRSEILLTIMFDCVHHTEMGKSARSSDPGHSNRHTDALSNLLSCTWSIWTSIIWICVCKGTFLQDFHIHVQFFQLTCIC